MIRVPQARSLSLRLTPPILDHRVQAGEGFPIRAEVRASGLDSCSIELELDPAHFSESHDFQNPLRLEGKKSVIRISYVVSALRRTPGPSVLALVARGNGEMMQRAEFSVEVL
jgi:uncharacterized protein (DUF58 family)